MSVFTIYALLCIPIPENDISGVFVWLFVVGGGSVVVVVALPLKESVIDKVISHDPVITLPRFFLQNEV